MSGFFDVFTLIVGDGCKRGNLKNTKHFFMMFNGYNQNEFRRRTSESGYDLDVAFRHIIDVKCFTTGSSLTDETFSEFKTYDCALTQVKCVAAFEFDFALIA